MKRLPKLLAIYFVFLFSASKSQIILVVANAASVCAGQSTTLLCQSNSQTVTGYSWVFGAAVNANTLSGTSITINSNVCGPLSFTCSAYSGTTVLASTTGSILIVCSTLSLAPVSQTLCGTASLTLTANANTSYSWSTGATTQSIVVSPTTSTSYSLFTGNATCPAISNITVFDLLPTASPASVCANSSFTLSANAPSSLIYNWFQTTNTLMPGGTASQVVTSTSVFPITYTVYAFFPAGCIRTKTITMQAYTYSPVAVYPSSVCAGSMFTMNGLNANSYTWTSSSQSLQASAYTTSQSIVSTYTLSADSFACRGKRVFQVGIYPPPNINISSPNYTICQNQSTQLYASGAFNYTWTNAPGMMSSLFGSSVIVSPTVTTIYSLSALSAQGCKGSTAVTVYVGFYPSLNVSSSNSVVCAGYFSTVIATGAATYTWLSSNSSNTLTGASQTLSAGNYTLIGSTGGSCRDSYLFSIGLLPPLSLSISTNAFQTCLDPSGNVKPVQLTIAGASSYTWQPFNPAQMTFSLGPQVIVTPTITTCYTVTGATALCMNTASICIQYAAACTGLEETDLLNSIQVFPNPSSHVIEINSNQLLMQRVSVYGMNGQLLNTLKDLPAHTCTLDVSDYALGIYLLQIQTNAGLRQIRLIRE